MTSPDHDAPAAASPDGDGDPIVPAAQPIPLLTPRDGTPTPLAGDAELDEFARRLATGGGPIAVDTERASGFRYGSRAYLIQIRRTGIGTALIDPIAIGDFGALQQALTTGEWVVHAATQDLPCLADLGLIPATLFDTELAGRLAGLPRVGLGPLVEQLLGLHLAKGHGADDWSRRPLPPSWLDYAALDVEVLVELRDVLADLLRRQGKLDWAEQEFAAILAAPPPPPRQDPWRRTSGIHAISDRRTLAAIRELYGVREELARARDLAPHRVLPDSAIIAAATAMPATVEELCALPVFSGRFQRRKADQYLVALDRARTIPAADLPPRRLAGGGPPPPSRWAHQDPAAATRLAAARDGLQALSGRVSVPVENLARPALIREILWVGPADEDMSVRLAAGGARPWQVELVTPILVAALAAPA